MEKRKNRAGNPVFKYMEDFNKPKTFHDRKKRKKNGYEKHKSCQKWQDYLIIPFKNILITVRQIN